MRPIAQRDLLMNFFGVDNILLCVACDEYTPHKAGRCEACHRESVIDAIISLINACDVAMVTCSPEGAEKCRAAISKAQKSAIWTQ